MTENGLPKRVFPKKNFFSLAKLDRAFLGAEMNAQLDEILGSTAEVAALQLSPRLFVIRTGITPITPLGFVHVYKTELGKIDCGLR